MLAYNSNINYNSKLLLIIVIDLFKNRNRLINVNEYI